MGLGLLLQVFTLLLLASLVTPSTLPKSFTLFGRRSTPPTFDPSQPLSTAYVKNLVAGIAAKYANHAHFIAAKAGPPNIRERSQIGAPALEKRATHTVTKTVTATVTVTRTVSQNNAAACSTTPTSSTTTRSSTSTSTSTTSSITSRASSTTSSQSTSSSSSPPVAATTGRSANIPLLDQVLYGNVDELYYGPIGVGTPSNTGILVDFDTGSADLWVMSNSLVQSSTYKATSSPFQITYGSGSVSGSVSTDNVTLAPGLPGVKRSFGVVNSVTGSFNGKQVTQGLLGLGFAALAQISGPTPMEQLIATGALLNPLFAMHMGRGQVTGSELSLGAVNPAHFSAAGTWTYFPVTSPYYWGLQLSSATSNGVSISDSTMAIVDSGTTLLIVPAALAASIYAQIPGSSVDTYYSGGGATFYDYPCNSVKATVSFTFSGSSKKFSINAVDLIFTASPAGNGLCVGSLYGMDIGLGGPSPGLILGDTFMKSWYTSFSYGTGAGPIIGFIENV